MSETTIQLGATYIFRDDAENPFASDFVIPVAIKDGWVQYDLCGMKTTWSLRSSRVSDFLKSRVIKP
jgi:hypothetical protein